MEDMAGSCADLSKLTRTGTGLGTFDLPGLFSHNYGQYARQATRGPRLPFNKCAPGLMWLSAPVQEGSSPAPLDTSLAYPRHVLAPRLQSRLASELCQRTGAGLNEDRDATRATGIAGCSGTAGPLASDVEGHLRGQTGAAD